MRKRPIDIECGNCHAVMDEDKYMARGLCPFCGSEKEMMEMNDNKQLFRTCIGSHMWGMQTPESDLDLFVAFIVPTRKILDGTANVRSMQTQYKNKDESHHEIGKIVDMILKGNVNFLWGVLSPVVEYEYKDSLWRLKELTEKSLSKNVAKSIHGLARHNYERYVRDNMGTKDVSGELLIKKANTIVRTLNFGVEILQEEPISFAPFYDQSMKSVQMWMDILLDAEKHSSLPDEPPNENDFRDYLFERRMLDLRGRDYV